MKGRYAAIDVGSNAIRLLVCDVTKKEGEFRLKKVAMIRIPIRLGADVFDIGEISLEKKESLVDAMCGFKHLMKSMGVEDYKAVATSALREAKNGQAVCDKILKKSGIELKLISGKKEAKILYSTQISQVLDDDKSYLYVDVGGGSTELSFFQGKNLKASDSFKVGTVRKMIGEVEQIEIERMATFVQDNATAYPVDTILGSGGNINKLIKLIGSSRRSLVASPDELNRIYQELANLTYKQRMEEFSLKADRADVIIPAAEIFLDVFGWSNAEELFVPKIGLSDGLILDMVKKR